MLRKTKGAFGNHIYLQGNAKSVFGNLTQISWLLCFSAPILPLPSANPQKLWISRSDGEGPDMEMLIHILVESTGHQTLP